MAEFLQGIGALALVVLGGGWLLRWHEERQESKFIQGQLDRLHAKLAANPADRESILAQMREVQAERKPRKPLL